MKKFLLSISIAAFSMSMAQPCFAAVQQYISAKGVYSHMKNDRTQSWAQKVYAGGQEITFSGSDNLNFSDKVGGARLAYGLAIPASIGRIRTELELGWNAPSEQNLTDIYGGKEKLKIQTYTGMGNIYLDFFTGTPLTPYVSTGIGYGHTKAKYRYTGGIGDESVNVDTDNLIWQAGAGVTFKMTKNVAIDMGYRYVDYGEIKKRYSNPYEGSNINHKVETTAHEILTGLRYTF